MKIREITESIESNILSPYAVLSANSRGRMREEEKCDIRTDFQRDRDRIIHCKAFRRLKHKTQVFISPEGDHYRTRLTHTLEVAQIARTIARGLRLNEDLTEAIALGHDLGHTPFGHTGEYVLNRLSPFGFKHNEQSLRIVDKIEGGAGLNLTFEVRDGILNHTGKGNPSSLEGSVVQISDRIAYINHDIDDALRAGILTQEEIPGDCLKVLGETHRERINTMVTDVILNSLDMPQISMSEEIKFYTDRLRSFMFERVYNAYGARPDEDRIERIIESLYDYLKKHPAELPGEFINICNEEGIDRAICDYIAGMTDNYAVKRFFDIFIPRPWRSNENL
ncbi:MAG: deoxyguanosinetriphosphate triphosphohydrolase [Thermoanaerobacteraceae bacterium]|nr:deoxyguanosinetriphosphate triphosphohydrolase [Thermoanaerobacteraceae bacterium]